MKLAPQLFYNRIYITNNTRVIASVVKQSDHYKNRLLLRKLIVMTENSSTFSLEIELKT